MLNKKIEDALNAQINEELFSAYLYQAMSAHFAAENLAGMSQWFGVQAGEELGHAKKLYAYILERGGRVILAAINAPQTTWESPEKAFSAAYEHEKHITGCINSLYDLSHEEKDHATTVMLQWFVTEQVEEEANVYSIVEKLKIINNNTNGIFMIDSKLGKRGRE